jgi:hypothetical protein
MPLILPSNSISAGGYEVDNSLRFNSGSSDYLERTPASDGNRKKWTWSAWIKRSKLGSEEFVFYSRESADNDTRFYFESDTFRFQNTVSNSTNTRLWTNRVFRDVSAWYHIVISYDSTVTTPDTNSIQMFVNGQKETSFSATIYPSQNQDTFVNDNSLHTIGRRSDGASKYFNGYMSEIVLIDGQALEPTSFGEFDEDTGIWKPIDVSGLTFGTNGFYLDFESSGSLGNDVSGNGNNFTVNNLTSIDQTTDTPTNNYATANSLDNNSNSTYSNGNTTIATGASEYAHTSTTLGVSSGKYYCEVKYISGVGGARIGVAGKTATSSTDGLNGGNYEIYYENNGNLDVEGTLTSSWGSTYTTGDIIGIGLDLDNNKIYFSKNGTWQNSADPSAGTGGETISSASSTTAGVYFFSISDNTSSGVLTVSYNFGNPPFTISSGNSDGNGYGNFEYSVPSEYYALNTKNLAEYG